MNIKLTKEQEEKYQLVAQILTIGGYRNSGIENIHRGTWPKNKEGKYASNEEVIVTTKDGGTIIPWNECSKIHDSEMKKLNKEINNNIFSLLIKLENGGLHPFMLALMTDSSWDKAEIVEALMNH